MFVRDTRKERGSECVGCGYCSDNCGRPGSRSDVYFNASKEAQGWKHPDVRGEYADKTKLGDEVHTEVHVQHV